MQTFLVLALAVVTVAAFPSTPERIIGGSAATIAQYPYIASLLYTSNLSTYAHSCGGVILNSRSILTGAQCPFGHTVDRWRARIGSALAGSGGTLHQFQIFITHPSYNANTFNNDIAIMRTNADIKEVNNAVRFASIAGPNYVVSDGESVQTAGWGRTTVTGANVNQLNHVQIWTINQFTCAHRYSEIAETVTNNMLCAGWLDVGDRDQCTGDQGGPLVHNGIVFGLGSWRLRCGLARYPGVYVRLSWFTDWIRSNA